MEPAELASVRALVAASGLGPMLKMLADNPEHRAQLEAFASQFGVSAEELDAVLADV